MSSAPPNERANDNANRPVYFGVVVWGEKFRLYLVDFLIGSLLAEGNFPADIGRRKVLLVCTPAEDWHFISAALTARGCDQFISVEWVEFEPDRTRPITSMSAAHSRCFRRAFDDGAYLSMLSPDAMYSVGFVEYLDRAIRKGQCLVLCPAYRVEERAFFAALGIDNRGTNNGGDRPVSFSAARLAEASIVSFHSEILTSNLNKHCFNSFPNNFHIQEADRSWFVSKNLSWSPVLIDLEKCDERLLAGVAESVIDSQILARMIDPNQGGLIDFVLDSKVIALASWAPEPWSARSLKPRLFQRLKWSKRLYNDLVMRITLRRYLFDQEGRLIDWIKVLGLTSCVVYAKPEADRSAIDRAITSLEASLTRTAEDILKGGPKSSYQSVLDRLRPVLWLVDAFDAQRGYVALGHSYYEVILDAFFNRGNARDRVRRRILRVFRV
jgi:hypothetical protein